MLQVSIGKTLRSQDRDSKTAGNQVWDPANSSFHTAGSQLSQPLEQDDSLINGLLTRNTADVQAADVQAALDNDKLAVRHRNADSAASANHSSSLEHSAHDKNLHEQTSKLGTEQTEVPASMQPNGTLNSVTSRSNSQLSAALHPASMPQADRDDLLIVMPSSIDRMPIVTASRGWRQGVRTYIAFEQEIDLKNASSIFRVRIHACPATPKRIYCSPDNCVHALAQPSIS